MRAFGREVASRTIAGVLAGIILAALGSAWKLGTPYLQGALLMPKREALAWSLVGGLSFALTVVYGYVLIAALKNRRPKKPGKNDFYTIDANSGAKGSVTLTNYGIPSTYHVDGRIESLIDKSQNPSPAPFRCELQVAGLNGQWEAELKDSEWANIILGTVEPVYGNGPLGRTPIGQTLVIRHGKMGHNVAVPDAGAIVELTIHAKPGGSPVHRFRVVRNAKTVKVTELT